MVDSSYLSGMRQVTETCCMRNYVLCEYLQSASTTDVSMKILHFCYLLVLLQAHNYATLAGN